MKDIDEIDPNVMTQGPGLSVLTNGNQDDAVSGLISSILKTAVSSDATYAVGEDKVYKLSSTTVTDDGTWPLSITGGTYQVADDLVYYKSNLLVFWNDTGTEGEIAKVDISGETIDSDWGSTTPTGAAHLEDAPHYGIVGGDDVVYITNGRYIATVESTTLDNTALDFWENSEAVSVTWNMNRIIVAVNRPNVSGSNFNQSAIYKWNGVSSTWEGDPIEVSGEIGALYTKNGITYVWWKDATTDGGYSFGYISGTRLEQLRRYEGGLPNQAQVGEHDGFIAWLSSDELYKWGSRDAQIPVKLFQYLTTTYSTAGAFAAPFGDILVASSDGSSNYEISKTSGYSTAATRKTRVFNVSGADFVSQIDLIKVETEQMSSGAKVDFTLTYNQGKSTQSLTQIAYSTDNDTRHKILNRAMANIEDFRLDISYANGSTSNPVNIRSIYIKGRYVKEN